MKTKQITNAISFDIEDWFHILGVDSLRGIDEWPKYESRVVKNTTKILNILEKFETKATFFILGWIAEQNPDLISLISSKGHELGTHGYSHSPIFELSKDDFKEELNKSIYAIESASQKKVLGFRAPSFSITNNCEWSFGIIKEAGLIYDSSLFFAKRSDGGFTPPKNFQKDIFLIETDYGKLLEYPMTIVDFLNTKIPACGGGYFRFYPLFLTDWLFKKTNGSGRPINFYLHPRDLDPDQPQLPMNFKKQIKSYTGLKGCQEKFVNLLKKYKFTSISKSIIINHKGNIQ